MPEGVSFMEADKETGGPGTMPTMVAYPGMGTEGVPPTQPPPAESPVGTTIVPPQQTPGPQQPQQQPDPVSLIKQLILAGQRKEAIEMFNKLPPEMREAARQQLSDVQ